MQRGNLKARFPITKMDEIGEAMLRFNKMADEIERLVERVRSTETARMSILQELAHDLRTPVASLKSMLETLSIRGEKVPGDLRAELMSLSVKEVDYFANLVEDLLFLAQASEPKYNQTPDRIEIADLVEGEVQGCEKSATENPVSVTRDFRLSTEEIRGDAHLLRRLFRNALDNAMSFAKRSITVRLTNPDLSHLECVIEDDGPGFSDQAIREFGHRKMSRKFSPSDNRRASIGLGSVIMTTIVHLHRGEIQASNRTDAGGKPLGGRVRIVLPM